MFCSTIQYENVHLKGQADPDIQRPDKWSSTVLQMEPPGKLTSVLGDDGLWCNQRCPLFCWNYEICGTSDEMRS